MLLLSLSCRSPANIRAHAHPAAFSEIEDCTQEWTFAPNSVDYVHIRWLVGSIVNWPALFQQAFRCLRPGGYLESYEATPRMESDDGSITETSAMHQWGKFFVEGGRKLGRTFTVASDGVQRTAMEQAGFVDIDEWNFKVRGTTVFFPFYFRTRGGGSYENGWIPKSR